MALAPSSPRLPSPPPPAEIQIGPKSPSGGAAASPEPTQMEQTVLDDHSRRRIHPGTKAADMAAGPPLVPLNELDSAFQLQEHLAALHYHHTASGTQALTRASALQLAQPPPGIDRTLWLYELCRFLISQCNSLIVGFLFDTPPCSANTCPEMRASEWQFLCAVHEQPKSCCAIDYCCHTLDWAANVVSDQKIFPSRFVVLNDPHSKNFGIKSLVNVFRRLHRIFAHAWFQHRSVFWTVEGQTGLYVFFKTVCDLYDLLPAENYKLPPEAEGLDGLQQEQEVENPPPSILKPSPSQQRQGGPEDDGLHPSSRTNTRRHIRSSPSTGSAVTTVMESDEEETDAVSSKMEDMHISAPHGEDEDSEVAEVPVIVDHSAMESSTRRNTSIHEPTQEHTKSESVSGPDATVVEVEPEHDEPQIEPLQPDNTADSPEDMTPVEAPTASEDAKADDKAEAAPVEEGAEPPTDEAAESPKETAAETSEDAKLTEDKPEAETQ
ncbi:hypothetical protein JDV02_007679 [Purpureocillium takamizusanense]|uniref:Mob1 family protein n=1 Tax=Purpureocillium takamizusanense TaxID=2060973 RepID=A0A9Q8QKN6_9HYPO|nr:uncharacterized protein JDV02_007679 [Purpureocillium takamizusanense]UNI21718.1 hypothetical protein JDV02_007679 [Purpureocillium takamizusanense]